MHRSGSCDQGFSLVELMTVVLIMGILVSIATPVYFNQAANAQSRTCQANQRVIASAVQLRGAIEGGSESVTEASVLDAGKGWGTILLPTYLKSPPRCMTNGGGLYNLSKEGVVLSDRGAGKVTFINQGESNDHQLQ